ncbi:hypothetical protein GGQ87_000042 [Brevundimonas alba]|uniref:Lipoprotein n=1 Tax=Brevundimonas alba TaxID=74314 RepID=A0A7X6BMA4_9CAUL|nr:hypothetical protein [Brevundimonas alba]NJC39784.1 hypothetical protein [Brevundimonas alba]
MRAPAMLLLSGLALAASACTTVEPTPAPLPVTGGSSGAPQPVAGYDWFFHADEENARLAYGLAESDDLKLGMECARSTGRLLLNAMAEKGAKAEIHVESGGETERFPAEAEPSQLNEGVFLSAEASAAEPVFQRFRRVGWLAQWRDGQREAYAPHPESADGIERFFAFCG